MINTKGYDKLLFNLHLTSLKKYALYTEQNTLLGSPQRYKEIYIHTKALLSD